MRPAIAALSTLALSVAVAAGLPATAAEPKPEIARPAAPAQAVGHAHALRTIPEACIRLEGEFTGDAAKPYRFSAVRTSPACQPRARRLSRHPSPAPAAGTRGSCARPRTGTASPRRR